MKKILLCILILSGCSASQECITANQMKKDYYTIFNDLIADQEVTIGEKSNIYLKLEKDAKIFLEPGVICIKHYDILNKKERLICEKRI